MSARTRTHAGATPTCTKTKKWNFYRFYSSGIEALSLPFDLLVCTVRNINCVHTCEPRAHMHTHPFNFEHLLIDSEILCFLTDRSTYADWYQFNYSRFFLDVSFQESASRENGNYNFFVVYFVSINRNGNFSRIHTDSSWKPHIYFCLFENGNGSNLLVFCRFFYYFVFEKMSFESCLCFICVLVAQQQKSKYNTVADTHSVETVNGFSG